MMKPAVRVLKAFPEVLNIAAVAALEIAAGTDGSLVPSRPTGTRPVMGLGVCNGPPPRIWTNEGAPVMLNTPSTLASRSVTATVTDLFSATAADTACAIIV